MSCVFTLVKIRICKDNMDTKKSDFEIIMNDIQLKSPNSYVHVSYTVLKNSIIKIYKSRYNSSKNNNNYSSNNNSEYTTFNYFNGKTPAILYFNVHL